MELQPVFSGPGQLSRYCDLLRAGRSGDQMVRKKRLLTRLYLSCSSPVYTCPAAHPSTPVLQLTRLYLSCSSPVYTCPAAHPSIPVLQLTRLYLSCRSPIFQVYGYLVFFPSTPSREIRTLLLSQFWALMYCSKVTFTYT